jgi:hypothetical protein
MMQHVDNCYYFPTFNCQGVWGTLTVGCCSYMSLT